MLGEPLLGGGHALHLGRNNGCDFIKALCSVLKKFDALSERRLFVCHTFE
jgi:hypothetical protein